MTANTTFTKTLDWAVANVKTSKTLGCNREQAYREYLDQYKNETDADRAIWFSHIVASDDCKRFLNGATFQSFDECVSKYRTHLFDIAYSTVYEVKEPEMTATTTYDAYDFTSLAHLFDNTTANATVHYDGNGFDDYLIVENHGRHMAFELDGGAFMMNPDFNPAADKWSPDDGMALLVASIDDDGSLFKHEPVIEHVSEHMTRGELEPVLAFIG